MLWKQKLPLAGQEAGDGFCVCPVVDTVAVYGAFDQVRRQKLGHMVMDGVPGQAEFRRQLLAVGIVAAQIAQNVEPGLVRQQADGLPDLRPGFLGRGQHGLQRAAQNAAIDLNGPAVRGCYCQQRVHTEDKGADDVAASAAGVQRGGAGDDSLRARFQDLLIEGRTAGFQQSRMSLQRCHHPAHQSQRLLKDILAPVEKLQHGHLALGRDVQG